MNDNSEWDIRRSIRLTRELQAAARRQMAGLHALLGAHSIKLDRLGDYVTQVNGQVESLTQTFAGWQVELRSAIENLIIANEVTRELAVTNRKRITRLEDNQSSF